MSAGFKTVRWGCAVPGCDEETSQRFGPNDGDPERAAPPSPWTLEVGEGGRFYFCPAHSEERERERRAAEIPPTATYEDCSDDEEVVEVWTEENLCLRCMNAGLCRFRPDDPAYQVLAVVSRCKRFDFDPDVDVEL